MENDIKTKDNNTLPMMGVRYIIVHERSWYNEYKGMCITMQVSG